MRTLHITSYSDFVKAGRPYYPEIRSGRLLLANFAINNDGGVSFSHHKRLVMTSVVVYNRSDLVAVYSCYVCNLGFRDRWTYIQSGQLVSWTRLTAVNQWRVACAFYRASKRGLLHDFVRVPSVWVTRWRTVILASVRSKIG